MILCLLGYAVRKNCKIVMVGMVVAVYVGVKRLLLLIFLICLPADTGVVTRVIDGDTVVLSSGKVIRLLGVDTPELHHPNKGVQCYGFEAKRYTERRVLNRGVVLSYEGRRVDYYGRTLAWVWVNRRLLNEDIIRYGFSYRKYPTIG